MGPSDAVADGVVVVSAEGIETGAAGGSVLGPSGAVVQVAAAGRYPAAGEDAGAVAGLDGAALRCCGASAGGAVVERQPGVGVGDAEAPLASAVGFGDLAGDVGDHRPVAGELARRLGESAEGGEIDTEFHDTESIGDFDKGRIPAWMWMPVERVVNVSLKSLGRRRVLVVPGFLNRLIVRGLRCPLTSSIMVR